MTYRIAVVVSGDRMTTKGCIVAGLLCKSIDWTRIDAGGQRPIERRNP